MLIFSHGSKDRVETEHLRRHGLARRPLLLRLLDPLRNLLTQSLSPSDGERLIWVWSPSLARAAPWATSASAGRVPASVALG